MVGLKVTNNGLNETIAVKLHMSSNRCALPQLVLG